MRPLSAEGGRFCISKTWIYAGSLLRSGYIRSFLKLPRRYRSDILIPYLGRHHATYFTGFCDKLMSGLNRSLTFIRYFCWGQIVKYNIKIIWLIILVQFVAGCSGYRLASFPDDLGGAKDLENSTQIEAGNAVRIVTKFGEVIEGTVTEIGADYLEILTPAVSGEILSFKSIDVARIEVYQSASPAASLGIASLVVGGVVGGYYLINYDGGGEENIAWAPTK